MNNQARAAFASAQESNRAILDRLVKLERERNAACARVAELEAELTKVNRDDVAEVARLRRGPRVWLDGDIVPAGTWVYVVDEDDPEEKVHQLDAYEDCRNGNLGPLIEIPLPDAEAAAALVKAEEGRRAAASGR